MVDVAQDPNPSEQQDRLGRASSTLTTAPDDPGYRKFLEDLRKEKLVKLAFGCSVRPEDFGRLMAYYDQGFATTGDICSAWPHRNLSRKPLSFRFSLFENIFLVFVVVYMVACALMSVLATVVLFSLPAEAGRQIVPYALVYLGLAGFTFLMFRGHFTAVMLRRREKRHSKAQNKATA